MKLTKINISELLQNVIGLTVCKFIYFHLQNLNLAFQTACIILWCCIHLHLNKTISECWNLFLYFLFFLFQNGITSCLMYLDFFSISAQRAALSITANCCQNMSIEEFHYIRDSISLLSGRLAQQVIQIFDLYCCSDIIMALKIIITISRCQPYWCCIADAVLLNDFSIKPKVFILWNVHHWVTTPEPIINYTRFID